MATYITSSVGVQEKIRSVALGRLGLWIFLVSDASFFAALVSSRYFVYGVQTPGEIDQFLGLGLTVILLISSLTA